MTYIYRSKILYHHHSCIVIHKSTKNGYPYSSALHFWICNAQFDRHCCMQHVSDSYWSVCICSTIGKHTFACNRHEIECLLQQESTDQKCLWVCLLHSIVISLVPEYHHHRPSVMHLSTNQGISLGQKNCTRTPFRKTFDGAGFLYFFGQKRAPIVLLQLKVMSCWAA